MPDDLRRSQIGRVRAIIDAMNIPIIEREGYEADDVIGSLSHKLLADQHNLRVLIITGDSDLLQLVEPGVEAVLPGRPHSRISAFTISMRWSIATDLGPSGFRTTKRWSGTRPTIFRACQELGEKDGHRANYEFGDVEAIIANLEAVKPPRAKAAIEANLDRLRLSKTLGHDRARSRDRSGSGPLCRRQLAIPRSRR